MVFIASGMHRCLRNVVNSAIAKFVWNTTWSITAKIAYNVVFVLLPFMAKALYNLSLFLILCGTPLIVKFAKILYEIFFPKTDDKQYAIASSSSAADQAKNDSQEEATSETSKSRSRKYDNSQTTATNNDSSLLLSGSGKDSEDGVRAPEDVKEEIAYFMPTSSSSDSDGDMDSSHKGGIKLDCSERNWTSPYWNCTKYDSSRMMAAKNDFILTDVNKEIPYSIPTLSSSDSDGDMDSSHKERIKLDCSERNWTSPYWNFTKYDSSRMMAAKNDFILTDVNKGHIRQDKPEEPICSDFLLGKCKKGSTCRKHHCPLPFHWQYISGGNWRSFTEEDNEKIEKVYCDEKLDECTVGDVKICFERFVQKRFDTVAAIRRLSTASYVTDPENTMATQWRWHWKDEYETWRKYDQDQEGGDLQQSLEDAFLRRENEFRFRIADQNYNMTFFPTSKMSQSNERYGTTKKVRRRPAKFVSRDDIKELRRPHKLQPSKAQQDMKTKSSPLPAHWSPMPSKIEYKRVRLAPRSDKFKEVEKLFRRSINRSVKIISIERVQNPFMWEKYQRKKENMSASRKSSANEKQLFHGTNPDIVEAICKQNFDWRVHGKNATVYGEGSYFAVNSSYSDAYAREDLSSSKFMFVARVLVGSYAVGQSSYRRPPKKDPSNPASDLYDSCVDNIRSPTIFVVFDIDQFYPEYIIQYSTI